MALNVLYRNPRGTRAALNSLAAGLGLLPGQFYVITDENKVAIALTASTYQDVANATDVNKLGVLTFVLDGGGVAIAANQETIIPDFPFAATITGWTILGDASGSAVVTVSKASYANFPTFTDISGTEKPTLTTAQKNQDLALTTWTTALSQGDILKAKVDSASTVKQLFVSLRYTRT
jgi:hypothetical protein